MLKKFTCLLAVFVVTNSGIYADQNPNLPKLTVEGHATLNKPADQISLSVGVVTLAKNAEEALAENSQKMQKVISELEKNGLEKTEYKTGGFSIQPTYTPYPKNPPPDWQATINGYEVRNSIHIKTEQIKQVGLFIDAASRAGANTIDQIQSGLKDDRSYWEEAITSATMNAISDAKTMAEAAGVKLHTLLSITLNNAEINPPQPLHPTLFRAKMATESQTPIEPGDLEIKANVTVVYEIIKP